MYQEGEKEEGAEGCAICPGHSWEVVQESHGRSKVQGGFQAPATFQTIMWLGSPHDVGIAHGRPYTRGLSVS